jgi:hypothetical protein
VGQGDPGGQHQGGVTRTLACGPLGGKRVRVVLARKWGGLFWATSWEKIVGGVTAIVSYRPGGWMQQSSVPRCAILSARSTGGIGQ